MELSHDQAVKLLNNVYVCPILCRNAIQLKAREGFEAVGSHCSLCFL